MYSGILQNWVFALLQKENHTAYYSFCTRIEQKKNNIAYEFFVTCVYSGKEIHEIQFFGYPCLQQRKITPNTIFWVPAGIEGKNYTKHNISVFVLGAQKKVTRTYNGRKKLPLAYFDFVHTLGTPHTTRVK